MICERGFREVCYTNGCKCSPIYSDWQQLQRYKEYRETMETQQTRQAQSDLVVFGIFMSISLCIFVPKIIRYGNDYLRRALVIISKKKGQ